MDIIPRPAAISVTANTTFAAATIANSIGAPNPA